jgi:predicted RNA-binding Zn-ribbon protein involved in translation (DUF1610 family)
MSILYTSEYHTNRISQKPDSGYEALICPNCGSIQNFGCKPTVCQDTWDSGSRRVEYRCDNCGFQEQDADWKPEKYKKTLELNTEKSSKGVE